MIHYITQEIFCKVVGGIEFVTILLYNQKTVHNVEKEGIMKKTRLYTYSRRVFAFATLVALLLTTLCFVSAKNPAETDKKTVCAGYSEEMLAAVYAHAGYKISLRNASYVRGGEDDGKMLTDRIYTNAKPQNDRDETEGWVMLESYDGITDYRVTVTVDIGFYAKSIARFYLRAFRGEAFGAEMPQRIRFYISENGEDFELLGEGSTMTDISVNNSAAVYSLTLDNTKNAR